MMSATALGLSTEFAGALRKIAVWREAWQNRLRVATAPEPTANRTIYFLTPDHNKPSGGVRVIYRHVDILNSAGINAAVLHQRRGFRCTWFENQTRVVSAASAKVMQGDVLVIPELFVDILDRIPSGISYIIFNQNSHLTWKTATPHVASHYTPGNGLAGVITVSDHNQAMLSHAFGHSDIRRVHVGIDSKIFHLPASPRRNRIAYMPRKMAGDAQQVLGLLRGRGLLDGWEVVALNGLSEAEVASQLMTTKIFLAFAYQEGFGLPPAEAMACGNYVVGNYGFGGREFFRPEFSSAVDAGDIVGFAQQVENVLVNERTQPGWCQSRGIEAARFVGSEYSLQRERSDVVGIYADLLDLK